MSGRSGGDDTARGDRNRRVRREDPQQSGPDRSWQGWLKNTPWSFAMGSQEQDPETGGETRSGPTAKNPMETVERGVKMAYQVVEDYIDQGRQAAQKLNNQQYGPREMGNDLQAVTERMMRDSTRFLSLWFELMGSAMGMAWGRGPATAPSRSGSASATTQSTHSTSRHERPGAPRPRPLGRARVAVEVTSQLAAQVEVELPPGADDRPLHVTPLQCLGSDAPQIRGVSFEPGTATRSAVVYLQVPADQDPGRYYGTLADPESHRSRGRILLSLSVPTDDAKASETRKSTAKRASSKRTPAKKTSAKTSTAKTSTKKSSGSKGSS